MINASTSKDPTIVCVLLLSHIQLDIELSGRSLGGYTMNSPLCLCVCVDAPPACSH